MYAKLKLAIVAVAMVASVIAGTAPAMAHDSGNRVAAGVLVGVITGVLIARPRYDSRRYRVQRNNGSQWNGSNEERVYGRHFRQYRPQPRVVYVPAPPPTVVYVPTPPQRSKRHESRIGHCHTRRVWDRYFHREIQKTTCYRLER